ncbi:hypothetical protein HYZ78_01970 [Candidatus Microgenomates bacterium]|nr:hypothetical protein [Candidatus Microgenomates bacterium]
MIDLWIIGKIFVIVGFLIYVVFAGVVLRQIYLMTQTVSMGFELPLRLIGWAHLGLAILALLFVATYL